MSYHDSLCPRRESCFKLGGVDISLFNIHINKYRDGAVLNDTSHCRRKACGNGYHLIATTNLATNFCDEAFARRFLFKMEFVKPEAETRAKIWKSMLDGLSDAEALTLASRYDFSGGNIENIARKATVGYVLSGQKATLQDLLTYCDEETLSTQKSGRRIGFNV